MTMGRISALALALSLGMLTVAEADEWTGAHLSFGAVVASVDLNSMASGTAGSGGDSTDTTAYAAVGYDWAVGGLTLGLVADIDDVSVSEDIISGGKGFANESDWFATLRGRVGMPVSDQMHVYASGGLAFMGVSSLAQFASGDTDRGTAQGAVVGIGMERMLSPGQHLSVEYLYADFDTEFLHSDSVSVAPVVNQLRIGYTFRF